MRDPVEELEKLTWLVSVDSLRQQPGAIVSRCGRDVREALSRLTSDDVAKMRVPEYVCRHGARRGRAR